MNIITTCIQGISCLTKGVCHFLNRIVECCKGKPKAKVARALKQEAKMLKQLNNRSVAKAKVARAVKQETKMLKQISNRSVDTIYIISQQNLRTGVNGLYFPKTCQKLPALEFDLRNHFIANQSQSWHIQTKKPSIIMMGDEHVPGVTKILNKKGYTVLGAKELAERLKQN